ncbi:MAG: hypothetical protein QM817_23630 [Archangium sp.]
MSIPQVVQTFAKAPFRWWVSGGHALELFVGDSWRDHEDVDVGIARSDLPALRTFLEGWELHVAARGELSPWNGEALSVATGQNALWCRHAKTQSWELEVLLSEADETHLQYRRDASIKLPWKEAVLTSSDGIPYLAPHLQLLYKTTTPRPRDHEDASAVIPKLSKAERKWLAEKLPGTHPWHRLLQ